METIITGTKQKQLQTRYGHNIVLLRLYLEEIIVRLTSIGRQLPLGNRQHPAWQAYGHYCAALLDASIMSDERGEWQDLQPWVGALAAGVPVPNYPYCTDLMALFSFAPLDPLHNALELVKACRQAGPPASETWSMLPLDAKDVRQHFRSAPVAPVLRLATVTLAKAPGEAPEPVSFLDDGRFRTALRIAYDGGSLKDYVLRHASNELWVRWLRDALLGIPLRDIVAEGRTFRAIKLLPKIMETAALPLGEHVYSVFSAIMNELWPPEAGRWISQAPRLVEANALIMQALNHASAYQGFEHLREVDLRLL